MVAHEIARAQAKEALIRIFDDGDLHEVRHLTGVGCLETSYGAGWKGAGKGSNNMGAIQAGAGWKGPVFEYVDTHPNNDGTSTTYRVAFRKYATPLEGWIDLGKVAYINRKRFTVRQAAHQNDTLGVSRELHRTGYYEGFGSTVEERIQHHYLALSRSLRAADGQVVEPVRPAVLVIPPTVRFGSGIVTPSLAGAVKLAQRELRLVADGLFGSITLRVVKQYQAAHQLKVDGVVGKETWTKLLTDEYVPEAA
jgi:peptidoglycan hydrolase-like protein with peptidoglycan-binding domain